MTFTAPATAQPPAAPLRLFAPTVLRQTENGDWHLMSGRDRGWSRFSYGPYLTLDDVRAAFAVVIGRAGEDKHSSYREVLPAPVGGAS